MLRVLFFARIREALGTDSLDIPVAEAGASVAELRQQLAARGVAWEEALNEPNLICAVNQVVVPGEQALAEGDEIAFYPPVTGG